MKAKLAKTELNFTADTLLDCDNVEELQTAGTLAIEARSAAENLVIGKIKNLENIIGADPMKILADLGPVSRNYQTQQVLKIMGIDNEPIVIIDEAGAMAAVKIGDDGELEIANKPTWVNSITLFRDSRTLSHGNSDKNDRIDRQTYRRKYRFESQAKRAEESFNKGEHFRNKQRKLE